MDKFLKNSKGFTPIVDFDEDLIKSKRSKEPSSKFTTGFTLIELLVVIAIIGILSSVVITSLNSAREKGKIALIKSTLKNMQSQAEITYNDTGSYASLFNTSAYDCIGPLSNMADSMTDKGVTIKCFSNNDSSKADVYLRFGATAILYDPNKIKAWSVDENGVVAWDLKGVNSSGLETGLDVSMSLSEAISSCSLSGGRLPSLEQLFTLARAYRTASLENTGTTITKPTGESFRALSYWSSSTIPSDSSNNYYVSLSSAGINPSISYNPYVHCVR